MANSVIATVVALTGTAYARNADGELRELKLGDVLLEGETVVTPDGGRVELSLADGNPLVIDDLPEMTLTADLIAERAAAREESAVEDETVDQVLAALEEGGDLNELLEATAAGGASGGAGGDGHSFIRLGRIVEGTNEFSGIAGSAGPEAAAAVEQDLELPTVDAIDDQTRTDQGEPVTISVEDNDQFEDGYTIIDFTDPGNGTAVLNPDGTITYTPDEGFSGTDTFTYTAASNSGDDDTAVVTIIVDPPIVIPPPEIFISIDDVEVTEGEIATLTISLSEASETPVSVRYASLDDTATVEGGDYDPDTQTITFAPGTTEITVSYQTNVDNIQEGEEDFLVNLSDASGATIADPQGVVTILDDYVLPEISIDNTEVTEGQQATLTVSLSRAVEVPVTVTFETEDDTAVAAVVGGDYDAATGILTIDPNTTSVEVIFQTKTDEELEGTEQFLVNLTNPVNATIADDQGIVEIVDNFSRPLPRASIDLDEVGGDSRIEVGELDGETVVSLFGNVGLDVRAGDVVSLTFGNGQTYSGVVAGDNSSYEILNIPVSVILANTQVSARVSGADEFGQPYSAQTSRTYVIESEDTTVSIAATDPEAIEDGVTFQNEEDETPDVLEFTVTLSETSTANTIVNYTASGQATEGTDYPTLTGTVTILAGETSAKIIIDPTNDIFFEGNETVTLTIDSTSNAVETIQINLAADAATGIIIDDQNSIYAKISVDLESVAEEGQLEYTVSLEDENGNPVDVAAGNSVTVQLDWTGAAAGGADTSALPASVDVVGGASTAQFIIQALDDYFAEGSEPLIATITDVIDNDSYFESVAPAGSPANSAITDEPESGEEDTIYAKIEVDLSSVPEEGQLEYTVTLVDKDGVAVTVPTGDNVNVQLTWTGEASGGADTSALPASVNVVGDASTAQFTIQALDDYFAEGSEPLIATVSGVTDTDNNYEAVAPAGAPDNVANSAITDEPESGEEDTIYAKIEVDLSSVPEEGQLEYTVTLVDKDGVAVTVPTGDNVNVQLTWTGEASGGADTSALPASVNVVGDASTAQFTIQALDDYFAEGSEPLIATVSGVTDTDSNYEAVAPAGAPDNVATSAITDEPESGEEDTIYAKIEVDLSSVPEEGQLEYTVTLVDKDGVAVTVPTGDNVNVQLTWTGEASGGADTSALPASVNVVGDASTAQFTIQALDDYFAEGSEPLIATVSGVTDTDSNYEAVAPAGAPDNVATSAITDEPESGEEDTIYAKIEVDLPTVEEGGDLTYTVTLVDKDGVAVTVPDDDSVNVQLAWTGEASGGADTSALPASVNVVGGASTAQFTINTVDDLEVENTEPLIATISGVTDTDNNYEAVAPAGAPDNVANSQITDNDVDDAPEVVSDTVVVEESDLPTGNPGSPGFPTSTGGSFSITTADVFESLAITGAGGVASFANIAALMAAIGTNTVHAIGEHGTLELTASSGTPETGMTIDYVYTLTSAEDHPLSPPIAPVGLDSSDGWDLFNIQVTDQGNGPLDSGTGEINVQIIDDQPVVISPSVALLENKAGESDTAVALDVDINIDDNVGADQDGTLTFTVPDGTKLSGENRDGEARQLTAGGKDIMLYSSIDGSVLYGATAAPAVAGTAPANADLVFTVTLNHVPGAGADTYDFDLNQKIDPEVIEFTVAGNDAYDFSGGNKEFLFWDIDDSAPEPDILLTPLAVDDSWVTELSGTVNSNDFQGGTNNGPTVQEGAGVRVNYVSGVAGTAESGGDGYDAPQDDHTFDSHETVNGALASFFTKDGASATIRFTAFQDTSALNAVKASQTVEAITSVLVTVNAVNYLFVADGTQGSITVDFDPANGVAGSVEVSGISDQDSVAVFADNTYNAVEIVHAGGDDFALGGYGGAIPGEEKFVSLDTFNLRLTDSDGDFVDMPGGLSIELEPEGVTILDAGQDALVGTAGDDVFVFELADAGVSETITSFGASGDDVLDLRDILAGEDSADLSAFLSIEESGGSAVISVSTAGEFTGDAVTDLALVDQTITLDSVLLSDLGGAGTEIADMIASGKLITD
jgi:Bacterial Ig domain/Calx-beta domain